MKPSPMLLPGMDTVRLFEKDVIDPPMLARDDIAPPPLVLGPSNTYTQHACAEAYVSVKVTTLPTGATKVDGGQDQALS